MSSGFDWIRSFELTRSPKRTSCGWCGPSLVWGWPGTSCGWRWSRAIPIVLVQLAIRFIGSARRRAQLRPGAQIYYDREWGSSRDLPRLVLAAIVFVLGYVGLAVAQGRGWTFVSTGIPTVVLLLVCIGIALSGVLLRR